MSEIQTKSFGQSQSVKVLPVIRSPKYLARKVELEVKKELETFDDLPN